MNPSHGRCPRCTPLTPALQQLLQACVTLQTTNAKTLALHLHRSPHTVRTEFQRILLALGVHTRYSALSVGETEGWLPVPREVPPPVALVSGAARVRHPGAVEPVAAAMSASAGL